MSYIKPNLSDGCGQLKVFLLRGFPWLMKQIYICDGCGREWDGSGGMLYGSILHMETCPDDLPIACCKTCVEIVRARVRSGEYQLPKLINHGYYCDVVKPRSGY